MRQRGRTAIKEKTQNHHGINISLWVEVGVEVGVVKEELGGGELVEGAMQLLLGRCVLYDSMWSVLLVGMVAVCHACADPSQVSSGKLTTLSYAGK